MQAGLEVEKRERKEIYHGLEKGTQFFVWSREIEF